MKMTIEIADELMKRVQRLARSEGTSFHLQGGSKSSWNGADPTRLGWNLLNWPSGRVMPHLHASHFFSIFAISAVN
jgi:hypothetical protein